MSATNEAIREILDVFGCSTASTEFPEAIESADGVIITPHYTVEKNTVCPEGYPDSLLNIKIDSGSSIEIYVSAECPNCKKCEVIGKAIPEINEIKNRYGISIPNQLFDGKKLSHYSHV